MTETLNSNSGRSQGREVPLSWFGKTLWKFWPFYVEMIVLAICLRLIGLVEPFIFQVVIDRILPFEREQSLVVVVLIFLAVALFQAFFEVISEYLGLLTANRATGELGGRLYGHLFRLPLRYFRGWNVGELIARLRETDTIRSFIIGTTTGVVLDLMFLIVYCTILFMLSAELTLIVLVALPLQVLIYFSFGPALRRRLRAQFDTGAGHQAQIVENITGVAAIKALASESEILSRLRDTLERSLHAAFRVRILGIANDKLLLAVDRLVTIAIVYFGAQAVFDGSLTLGELIAFHLIAQKITGPIENFSVLWESWQNVRISRQRLGDVLFAEPEGTGPLAKLPSDTRGHLSFRDVSFAYADGTPVLQNLNFEAAPETTTVVVGPSGIGKSTFGRLAAGIEKPLSGKIVLDRSDIARFDPTDVRRKIVYVPQEPFLFSGTLRDNLLLGRSGIGDDDLIAALRISVADRLVSQLPDGLDTFIGERGASLSGGQRQRVAIARSIVTMPKVLVLDEPTSALDEAAQTAFAKNLSDLGNEVTLIIITHRQEVFDGVDQVLDLGATT